MDLIIDPTIQQHLPPASKEADRELERQILAEGRPRDPIRVWRQTNTILDGHRRYEVCTRLGVAFSVEYVDLDSLDEALHWVDEWQLARRNLAPHQEALIVARLAKRAIAQAGDGKRDAAIAETAEKVGVTKRQVYRSLERVAHAEKLIPEVREGLTNGSLSLSADSIDKLSKMGTGQQRKVYEKFRDGVQRSLGQAVKAALPGGQQVATKLPKVLFRDWHRQLGMLKRITADIRRQRTEEAGGRVLELLNQAGGLAETWEREEP